MHVAPHSSINTVIEEFFIKNHGKFDDKNLKEEEVSVVNINDLTSDLKIDHIDFLKIDIEGSEYELFETIDEDYLSNNKINLTGYRKDVAQLVGCYSDEIENGM